MKTVIITNKYLIPKILIPVKSKAWFLLILPKKDYHPNKEIAKLFKMLIAQQKKLEFLLQKKKFKLWEISLILLSHLNFLNDWIKFIYIFLIIKKKSFLKKT